MQTTQAPKEHRAKVIFPGEHGHQEHSLRHKPRTLRGFGREAERARRLSDTASLRTSTKILDFRGFDSNIILSLRGAILVSIGNFPESLSQQNLSRSNLSREIGRTISGLTSVRLS